MNRTSFLENVSIHSVKQQNNTRSLLFLLIREDASEEIDSGCIMVHLCSLTAPEGPKLRG